MNVCPTTRKGPPTQSQEGCTGWRMPALPSDNSASGCDAGIPMATKALDAGCCLSGIGASLCRRGEDTRAYGLLPVPGKGMSEQAESLPAPCRRVRRLHVSCPLLDRTGAAV